MSLDHYVQYAVDERKKKTGRDYNADMLMNCEVMQIHVDLAVRSIVEGERGLGDGHFAALQDILRLEYRKCYRTDLDWGAPNPFRVGMSVKEAYDIFQDLRLYRAFFNIHI